MPDQNHEFLNAFPTRFRAGHQAELANPPVPAARMRVRMEVRRPAHAPRCRHVLMLFCMVMVALGLRLWIVHRTYQIQMNPVMDYWFLGQEEGHVAKSIVQGHGFGNPLYTPTGPSAWFAPVYPYFLAANLKIFGIYTTAFCIAILCFNALVSSLTCLPIFFFARRSFGYGAALAAGWAWAGYPYAVYWPVHRVWDTWLATLLLAVLFCLILNLQRSSKTKHWVGFGVLAGFAALTDPIVLGVLPILALWAAWRLHKQGKRWFMPAVGAVLAVIFTVSPWMIRNAVVFHKFIPIRDNLALEFRVGNSGDSSEPITIDAGPWVPWVDNTEWNEYLNMGELAYFHLKGQQAATYIKAHPIWYAGMVGRRILYIWTGFWSFSDRYMRDLYVNHRIDRITVPLLTLLSILTFMGLGRAFCKRGSNVATPYALVLIFFPLIYYFTHVGGWYRCPMDPFIVTLASYEVHSRVAGWLRRWREKRRASNLPMLPPTEEESPLVQVAQYSD
jgi:hypothetical protein